MTVTHDSHDERCADYVGLLVRAADNSLGADGRARLDTHIAGCDACRAALDAQQLAHGLVAAAFEVDPPFGFTTRVLAHVEPHESWLDRLDLRRWTWRISPVAAGLFLAAWMTAAGSETTAASDAVDVVNAADAGEQPVAVLLSDAVDQTDLVSLLWDAEVGAVSVVESSGETPQ